MAIVAVKSTSITNLDASPRVMNTQGEGAGFSMEEIDDYVTITAAASITSVFRVVRVPTTVKMKSLIFESQAQGAGVVDIGVYYSASVDDSPAAAALAGAVVDQDFFASSVNLASLVVPTQEINESTTYSLDKRSLPLWQAVGLSADPGGWFDIALTVVGTDVTTGTGKAGLRAGYAK